MKSPPPHPHFCQRPHPLGLTFFCGGGRRGFKSQTYNNPPFCTHALSGRAKLTLAQKRTSCCMNCTRRPCSTLLQPSSSLQLGVQCRLEKMHRFHSLSSSLLVPHHANPKGSFQVGWWRTRSYCHCFPRKVQVLLHSHKQLGRGRWLPSPTGQHGHQSCRSRPDNASHVPQPTSHQDAIIRWYFQCSTDLEIAQRVLVSLKTRSASCPAQSAVVHRSNNPKGVE